MFCSWKLTDDPALILYTDHVHMYMYMYMYVYVYLERGQLHHVHVYTSDLNINPDSLEGVKKTLYLLSITIPGQHCRKAKKYSPSPTSDGSSMSSSAEKLYILCGLSSVGTH